MPVIRTGARLLVEPRHGFEIVVHDVGRALGQDIERDVEPAAEIRHEHFDTRLRRALAHRAYAVLEMPRAAVAQIVAVDARDDDVLELQRRDRFGKMQRFLGIGRKRPAVRDVAERAAARAQVAEDHESRRAFAETLADVGARRFLAHRMELVLAQDLLDFLEALAVAEAARGSSRVS